MIAELVRRAQGGDAAAFSELVRRFQEAAFGAAYQKVWDVEAARDIAQEAFVRAYTGLGTLRDPASFPTWLLRICRNLAADWLRRPERSWRSLEEVDLRGHDVAPAAATRDAVHRALSALPENNRLAVVLFLVNGYTYREIAGMTGVPATTVKGRIERGKRHLAEEMMSHMEETLKSGAPGDDFTLKTVRESLARASQAWSAGELRTARSIAEEANAQLAQAEGGVEIAALRLEALDLIAASELRGGSKGWKRAWRDALRLCEETGDDVRAAEYLWLMAARDHDLQEGERESLLQRCCELARATGQHEYLMWALFMRCRIQMGFGEFQRAFSLLDEAREALKGHDSGRWHPALEAAAELRGVLRTQGGAEGLVCAYAGGHAVKIEEKRLTLGLCGNVGFWNVGLQERGKLASAFGPVYVITWLPHTGAEAAREEEKESRALYRDYTPYRRRTRLWVESDKASVATPAGQYDSCLLLRATTTESPAPEQPGRALGERWWWFARGVGPVAYRAERLDGVVEHALLAKFECPEQRDEWVPLVEGARWQYVPAEAAPHLQTTIVAWFCCVDPDGESHLAELRLGRRR